ncbi:hypothetical protein [Roseicyclus marinus]|uniref:hypothetical protein n=1 Tax=Roseicyclus marinus TaxID=2161673 RepID=UPI00241007B9|nr:hypothetical protein [Roseicyclus marinus]MDG3041743.1 hypothetical protein [Roseicyclus marinus]
MSRMDYLRQGGTPFDGFLYAQLGEDSTGHEVSVLSALARLGLDPWDEAAALSALPRDSAAARLAGHLARVSSLPDLGAERTTIPPRLIALLPHRRDTRDGADLRNVVTARLGRIGPMIALILAILFLLQTLGFGLSGAGG